VNTDQTDALAEREPPAGADPLFGGSIGSGSCARCELTIDPQPAEAGPSLRVGIAIREPGDADGAARAPILMTVERGGELAATIELGHQVRLVD
jgi:hypothetical protein